jgi:predicted RNA-binding Zn ribbon-like protein
VDAELLMDFANTLDERSFSVHGVIHEGGDELANADATARWLRQHSLLRRGAQVTGAETRKLLELRTGLRDALAALAGHADDSAITRLNAVLARLPVAVLLDAGGDPELVATGGGTPGRLSQAVARLAAAHDWHRLRMCAAPDCRWVFYDTARNAGGRWCSMAVCGNRDKTRRYRQRQAAG